MRYSVGGDRGRWLADGRLLFLGREAMCINTGGEKVFVEEVERILKSHAAIDDALVVGTPSERWGQQVTAVVSLRAGAGGAHAGGRARALRAASRRLQDPESARDGARDRAQPERQAGLRLGEGVRGRRARGDRRLTRLVRSGRIGLRG